MTTNDLTCRALTKSGTPCKLKADSSGYCHVHNPTNVADREAEKRHVQLTKFEMPERRFSERRGYKPVFDIIQVESMNDGLRTSLWNVLSFRFLVNYRDESILYDTRYYGIPVYKFLQQLWIRVLQRPLDLMPAERKVIINEVRNYFFNCEWYAVYDFLEFVLNYFESPDLANDTNFVLERELAGYRFVGGVFTEVTDDQEIEMLEQAVADTDFPHVAEHLKRALALMSDRENPDYRNSIKESISALESLAKAITGKPKASLSEALKTLENSAKLHPALKTSFLSLYGYTSDENGIRHAMLEESSLTAADAKFFLLSCTSFINYLKSKI